MNPSDLDTLADYVEGLLAGTPEGAAVAARIAADPTWADAYQQLTGANQEVVGALRGLADPPLPDEVAAQLDRALAAEHRITPTPTSRESEDDHEAAGWSKPAVGAQRPRSRRPSRRLGGRAAQIGGWTAAAAAVALVAVTGLATLHSSSSDDTASSDSAASAPKRAPAAESSGRSSGFPYTSSSLGPQARALLGSATPTGPKPTSAASAEAPPTSAASAEVPKAAPRPVPSLDRLTAPSALGACLAALGVASPLAVDYATLDGAPAVVIVTAGPGSTRLTVVAAGPNCGLNGATDQLARVIVAR